MQDLERQLQQKTAQLAALREIGRAINTAWELEATLDLITQRTADVMGMDSSRLLQGLDGQGRYRSTKRGISSGSPASNTPS